MAALRPTLCPCCGTDEMCPCQNDPALRRPTFIDSRIAQLSAGIDHLDSTDGHQNRANAPRRHELEEERAELVWRRENPGNSGRFRCAFRGRPIPFLEGGGSCAFNAREEAEAYLRSIGKAGDPECGVIDTAPDRDDALASVRLHMRETAPALNPEADAQRAALDAALKNATWNTPIGREPARAGRL